MNISNQEDTCQNNSKTITTFLSSKKEILLLAVLNIFFLSLSLIFGYAVVFYNTKFIKDYFNNKNKNLSIELNKTGFTNLFSTISIISFGIFLVILFLLVRKIAEHYSENMYLYSLILLDIFLFLLTILFGRYSNFYTSKFNQYADFYGIVNSFYANISSLFTSLLIVSIFAFFCVFLLILFNLYNFFKKSQQTSINIPLDYGHNFFTQNFFNLEKVSNHFNPTKLNKSQPFIRNKADVIPSHVSNDCPNCGSQKNKYDIFCQKCGNKLDNG